MPVFQQGVTSEIALSNGWFVNLFSKEGRAENKKNRADRKRERAAEATREGNLDKAERLKKSADRLEMKAGTLEQEASGGQFIEPVTANAEILWESPFPWPQRKRQTTFKRLARQKSIANQALGWQPIKDFSTSETRATIYGGIEALQLAGVGNWASVKLDSSAVHPKDNALDFLFLEWTSQASGKKFRNIKDAAEYVRKEVIQNKLQKAAWACRALVLLGIASDRLAKKTTITGAAGSGLMTAGMAITVATGASGIGAIVGGVIVGIGALSSLASAASGANAAKAEAHITEFMMMRASAIAVRTAEQEVKMLESAAGKEKIRSEIATEVTEQVSYELEVAREYQMANMAKILAISAGISMVSFAAVRVIKSRKNQT